MCAWNCEGWLQKLGLEVVVCFLLSFDTFSLSKSLVDAEQRMSDYDVFVSKSADCYHFKPGSKAVYWSLCENTCHHL